VNDKAITLSNTSNAITGAVTLTTQGTAGHATLDNGTTNLDLAASTVNGNLGVTSGGTITQAGALTVSGTGSFTTDVNDKAITLSNTSNAITGNVAFTTQGTAGNVVFDNGTSDIVFNASMIAGSLSATSGNASGITDAGAVSVTNGATFTTDANNGVVTMDTMQMTGGDLILNTNGTGNVTIVNSVGVDFGTSSVGGNLAVTATTGNITQNGGALAVGGTSALTTSANDADITLANTSNALTGAVTLSTAGTAGNATLDNGTKNLVLAASTVNGNLGVTTGGTITQTGALSISGTTSLTTTLANTGNVSIVNNAAGTNLGNVLVGGNFTLTNAGQAITESGTVKVAGNLNLTGSNINLTNGNDVFGGTITLNDGGSAIINQLGVVNLAATNVTGNLTVTSKSSGESFAGTFGGNAITLNSATNSFGGALSITTKTQTLNPTGPAVSGITQSGAVVVSGDITLNAQSTGDITLNNAGNNFNNLTIGSGKDVIITDSNAANFKASTVTGNLTISTGGNLTDSGNISAGILTITSGGSVTLDSTGNTFTSLGAISRNGNVTILDSAGGLTLAGNIGGTTTNDITIRTVGDLTINAGVSVVTTGAGNDIVLEANTGKFTNNAGATTLQSDSRYLVYSKNNGQATLGGLPGTQVGNVLYPADPLGAGFVFYFADVIPVIVPNTSAINLPIISSSTLQSLSPTTTPLSAVLSSELFSSIFQTAQRVEPIRFQQPLLVESTFDISAVPNGALIMASSVINQEKGTLTIGSEVNSVTTGMVSEKAVNIDKGSLKITDEVNAESLSPVSNSQDVEGRGKGELKVAEDVDSQAESIADQGQ
jgi:hypothetical protein